MKKIAITQRLIQNENYYEIREALDINYCKLVNACGFLPIVLPYEIEFNKYFEELRIDGVILTGGNDLNSCNCNELSKKRDIFEKKLLAYCIKNKIPILGICRGMQVIAEYFGSNFKYVENQVNIKHDLKVSENSKYKTYLKKLTKVNSFHNYEINNISNEFIISATDKINVIKAIEHKNHKIFAQMWHTEREKQFNDKEMDLIKGFFR